MIESSKTIKHGRYMQEYRKTSKHKEYQKQYKKTHKENFKIYRAHERNKTYFGGMRDKVLERDNWECQLCGMTNEQHIILFGRNITIDHKDGQGRYSQIQNNSLDNLWTLCLRCHGKKDGARKYEHR